MALLNLFMKFEILFDQKHSFEALEKKFSKLIDMGSVQLVNIDYKPAYNSDNSYI